MRPRFTWEKEIDLLVGQIQGACEGDACLFIGQSFVRGRFVRFCFDVADHLQKTSIVGVAFSNPFEEDFVVDRLIAN